MAGKWVLEVDIRNFFDSLDHSHLRDIVRKRVRDGVLLRLIGEWLKAGVMEDGRTSDAAGDNLALSGCPSVRRRSSSSLARSGLSGRVSNDVSPRWQNAGFAYTGCGIGDQLFGPALHLC
jgi:hypothetical protein